MSNQNLMHYIRADARPSYRGPGDRYTFLVTGARNPAVPTASSSRQNEKRRNPDSTRIQ